MENEYQQPQGNRSAYIIPLSIIIAGVLVAGAIYFGGSTPNLSLTGGVNNDSGTEVDVAPVTAEDHIIGSRNADIVIVEYSDTECPFCKVFHETMKEVIRTYGDDVAWVYRHFPIAQLHAKAVTEAEATECAAELGGNEGFWNYIDEVFERTNSNDSLDPTELPRIAGDVGLDINEFNTCLSSERYNQAVLNSVEKAVQAGARGTPYSVIIYKGGRDMDFINGAEPLELVKSKIDALLN